MADDLEHELLRAAQAFCAWRAHVRRDADETGFTCDEVLSFIEQTKADSAFPRISHRLVAHVIDGLAESLARSGYFERVSTSLYALTEQAFAHLDRKPIYLDPSLPEVPDLETLTLAERRSNK
jgi:hypothetical protein